MQNNEELNKSAWNSEVIKHNYWTKAVSQEQIERAKNKDLTLEGDGWRLISEEDVKLENNPLSSLKDLL